MGGPLEGSTGSGMSLLEQLVESVPAAIWLTDQSLDLVWCGGALLSRMSSRPPAELIGRSALELSPLQDRPLAAAWYDRALAGQTVSFEERWRAARCRIRLTPIFHQGQVIGCGGYADDVTDQRATEEDLIESEDRFRLAFTTGPIAMGMATADGTIEYANRALCQMLGYEERELVGRNIREITVAEDFVAQMELAAPMIEGVSPAYMIEKRYIPKSGEPIWAKVTVSAVRDADGNFLYSLGMIEDISERKRTERVLHEAERLASLGTLAAGIAHEVNNPLAGIVTYAEVGRRAMRTADGQSMLDTALSGIETEAIRAGKIIKGVLKFARQQAAEKSPQDLPPIIYRARELVLEAFGQQDCEIAVDVAELLPPVIINPLEIEQVLVNVLQNAVQASPPGCAVNLYARSVHGMAQIEVVDHGAGMNEAQLRRLWDPFFTTRAQEGAVGLGLSLAYGVIRQHNGTIEAASKPGEGTRITIRLPVASDR